MRGFESAYVRKVAPVDGHASTRFGGMWFSNDPLPAAHAAPDASA